MLTQITDIHIYILNTCNISSYEYPGFCYKLPR